MPANRELRLELTAHLQRIADIRRELEATEDIVLMDAIQRMAPDAGPDVTMRAVRAVREVIGHESATGR